MARLPFAFIGAVPVFGTWWVACWLLLVAPTALCSESPVVERGEYGAELSLLRSFYRPPDAGESNHYFDLWGRGKLRTCLTGHGITNNRALIVLSHGKGISRNWILRYGYYPDPWVWPAKNVPYFSAADLARVMGREQSESIHNVVIAGCNMEKAFDPQEVRRYFVNATNVTHAPAGKNGFELVFRHTLLYHSSGIRLLYAMPSDFKLGQFNVSPRARKLGFTPYVACLYRRGERLPYAREIAGRELIDPSVLGSTIMHKPELELAGAAQQILSAGQGRAAIMPAGESPRQTVSPPASEQATLMTRAPLPKQPSSGVIRWGHGHLAAGSASRGASASSTNVVRWATPK